MGQNRLRSPSSSLIQAFHSQKTASTASEAATIFGWRSSTLKRNLSLSGTVLKLAEAAACGGGTDLVPSVTCCACCLARLPKTLAQISRKVGAGAGRPQRIKKRRRKVLNRDLIHRHARDKPHFQKEYLSILFAWIRSFHNQSQIQAPSLF